MYGACDSDLNVIQRFLDRCHKRHFTSQTVSIFDLLEQLDKSAFKRAINPLRPNSDPSQTSHCNIKGLSVSEVMRIENMITQVRFY